MTAMVSPDPATAQSAADVARAYRERAERLGAALREAQGAESRIGALRLVVFFVFLGALIWLVATKSPSQATIEIVAVVALIGFSVLVVVHGRLRDREQRLAHSKAYQERGEQRVNRSWEALPEVPGPDSVAACPYAEDLGIVGHASLLQLLDVTSTAPGRTTLQSWLLEPSAPPGEVRDRQVAARELMPRQALREEMGVLAMMAGTTRPDTLDRFLTWCESPLWLRTHPAFLWSIRLVTAATIVTGILQMTGVLARPIWLVTASAGLLLLATQRKQLGESARAAGFRAAAPRSHAAMLRRLAAESFASPLLQRIQARIATGGGAGARLALLEQRLAWAEVRYSPMLYAALQWLLQWDVHVVDRLEHWRSESGVHARDWMAALGEAEALAAFATLAHDNPGWVFPDITDSASPVIIARALAHPLLAAQGRVANDVTVGPPGTFLLVTGSNMSGKSTLLRSIGANVVLAAAGAPVCAASLSTPLLAVRTSIRIADSLEGGISLFMAELRRLKTIVDDAREMPGGCSVLYLLDEILHGTNTAERRIAARIVIGHLLRACSIGAVTTHDLSLASDDGLSSAAHAVHFTEQFDRGADQTVMSFDYRLLPGLATSANALALLELVGLGAGETGKGHQGIGTG